MIAPSIALLNNLRITDHIHDEESSIANVCRLYEPGEAVSLDTRLVIVLSSALTETEAVNAAAVLGLAASAHTSHLGAKAVDGDGRGYGALDPHPIPILAAPPSDLTGLYEKAEADAALGVTAFTEAARRSRDYDDYLSRLTATRSADVTYAGLAIYGRRSRVTAATKRLALYGAAS
jgi:hypothetical protein